MKAGNLSCALVLCEPYKAENQSWDNLLGAISLVVFLWLPNNCWRKSIQNVGGIS